MGKFVPSDWIPMGGFAFKTTDMVEAAKIFAEIDGLTGQATEGRHKGVQWITAQKHRDLMIESAQNRD